MLVFPPYQGSYTLWHGGLCDCGQGRQLSHLVFFDLDFDIEPSLCSRLQ